MTFARDAESVPGTLFAAHEDDGRVMVEEADDDANTG
jgi:hypothetical protein